ncbi:superoxide dismutase 1 copper chaperone [Trichomonascus vanleenenianus]|uniref:copper chaperone CCS1 n=1 Tax=Trichomonascus vanleenenianus TaxID=2268995 RepID=UPI003EC96D49
MDKFTSLYSVQMDCQSCADSIQKALKTPPIGECIDKVDINLKEQLVSVYGSCAPSQIVSAIQSTGRDAVVRGTGEPNSAAVCILESHKLNTVNGLARIVAVSPSQAIFDLTVSNLVPNASYYSSVRVSGDVSRAALSTGGAYLDLGKFDTDASGNAQVFLKQSVSISELIGRAMTISRTPELTDSSFVGVVARSAGVWENLKQVCTCSGKTVWQERSDAIQKGL